MLTTGDETRTQHYFSDIPIEDIQPKANHKETTDKPKLTDTPQNNYSVVFKSVYVTKVQQRQRNCYGLKETEEIRHVKAMRHSELDAFAVRDITGTLLEQKLRTGWQ